MRTALPGASPDSEGQLSEWDSCSNTEFDCTNGRLRWQHSGTRYRGQLKRSTGRNVLEVNGSDRCSFTCVEVLGPSTEPSERHRSENNRQARAVADLAWQMDGLKAEQELERRADLARSKARAEAKPGGAWGSATASRAMHGSSAGNIDVVRDAAINHSDVATAEQEKRQQLLQKCKTLQHTLSVQLQRQESYQGPFRPLLPSEHRRSLLVVPPSAPELASEFVPEPEAGSEPELTSCAAEYMTPKTSGPELVLEPELEPEDEQEKMTDAVAVDLEMPTDMVDAEHSLTDSVVNQTDGMDATEFASTVPDDDDAGEVATEPAIEEPTGSTAGVDKYEDGSYSEDDDNVDHDDNYAEDDQFEDVDPEDTESESKAVRSAAEKRK